MPQKNTNNDGYNRNLIGNERGSNTAVAILNLNDTISNQMASILENISFSVMKTLSVTGGDILSVVSNFFNKSENENPEEIQKIRELLKDHHSTFALFEKSIIAASKIDNNNTPISIDLYKRDINNPKFIATLETAIQSGIDPKLLILDILPDDYGLVDLDFINNLKIMTNLGFSFSFHSFVLDGDKIKVSNLTKLITENIYPKFIKISKDVYHILQNSVREISKEVKKCYDTLKEIGIQFIESHSIQGRYFYNTSSQEIPSFFRNSTIKKESILQINGKEYGKELLIRFGEGVSVPQGLEEMKKRGMTMLVVEKMLKEATADIVLGERRSINIYIKNLGDKNFRSEILYNTSGIPIDFRKNLIFEILEDEYGVLGDRVIDNILFFQKSGFSVAIDDLYLSDNHEGMSNEILDTFIEKKMCPDIIKIDGRDIQKICSLNTNTDTKTIEDIKNLIHHLKEVIGYFSLLPKPPKYMAEWIQNTDEAKKIQDLLNINEDKLFFQGSNIQSGSFGLCVLK